MFKVTDKEILSLLTSICDQLESNMELIKEVHALIPTEKKDTLKKEEQKDVHEKEGQKRWYTIQEYIKEYGFDIDIPFLPLVELEAIDTCRKLGYGFLDTENRYWHKFVDTILEKVIDDQFKDDCDDDDDDDEDCPCYDCPYYSDDEKDLTH